jgi:hypothetical protein
MHQTDHEQLVHFANSRYLPLADLRHACVEFGLPAPTTRGEAQATLRAAAEAASPVVYFTFDLDTATPRRKNCRATFDTGPAAP